jgi:hypothetical protein
MIVEGDESAVATSLASQGFDAAILENSKIDDQRSKLIVRFEDEGTLGPRLIESLGKQNNFTLHSLAPRQPTLEEIFLAATKRSWEETIDSKPKAPAA